VIAPKLLGGTAARTALGDLELPSLAAAHPWHDVALQRLGSDLLWILDQR